MNEFEQDLIRGLEKSNTSLRAKLKLAEQQRDEMARELEKLREHTYEKFGHKRNRP